MQRSKETETVDNIEQFMITMGLPVFHDEWERPEHEPTRYLAAIFKFWIRKKMFPERKPNIHDLAVKYRCSLT